MRRDVPLFAAVVVIAVVISFFTGSTAARRTSAPAGTAAVTARTLVCPAVNGLPRHTTATAVAADVGGTLSPVPSPAGAGTVTSSVLNGLKASRSAAMHLGPTAEVHSTALQSESVAITGNGSIAANLAADELSETVSGRYRALAGGNCLPPATDWWFAGGNGKLGFTDRLILANPAGTDADVGVTVWTPHGVTTPPRFAAIRVPAESRVSIGLLAVAPDISTLAMHVHAESGAVVAAVVDRRTSGLDSDGGDLVPPTLPPSRHPVIAGFPAGTGTRTLVLANPGTADASVSVKVVTAVGEFTPSSVKPVVVGPGRTSVVDLSNAFNGGGGAVLVNSDQPVLAEGRTILTPSGRRLRPDLSWAPAAHPLSGPAGVAIGHEPDGGVCVLVLSAPAGAASVRVTTPSGGSQTITVAAGHSESVDITSTVRSGTGEWPFLVTPVGSAPVYGARQLYFSGAHGALLTTEPLVGLPRPISLPTVRQDPRIAVR
ncbi:MAG TPA: DUF5719 family protein [Mycobacteriales bacterium]|nr:DUF5719 family protein [Mycobacteriales bacterium]